MSRPGDRRRPARCTPCPGHGRHRALRPDFHPLSRQEKVLKTKLSIPLINPVRKEEAVKPINPTTWQHLGEGWGTGRPGPLGG